jgi:DegV family protein with EDD domain
MSNKIQITADSTIDLSPELYERFNIKVLPFVVTLGEETFYDGVNITPKDIFAYFSKTGELPKTGARSPEDFTEFFKKYTDDGYDVVHVGIGAELSSGYANAVLAANGNPHVYVVDSRTLSSGSGLLAMYASELASSGKYSAEEIAKKVGERAYYGQSSFIIEKLKFLYKGGRCSMLSMLGANIMRIKPCIRVVDGKNKVGKKYIGNMDSCVRKYMEDTLQTFNTPDHTRVMITYPSMTDAMRKAVEEVLAKYGKFKEILYTQAGSVISSHCGENTVGILYLNDGDEGHY